MSLSLIPLLVCDRIPDFPDKFVCACVSRQHGEAVERRNGDPEAKAVAVGDSPMRVLADASETTGLPRDNFEIHGLKLR